SRKSGLPVVRDRRKFALEAATSPPAMSSTSRHRLPHHIRRPEVSDDVDRRSRRGRSHDRSPREGVRMRRRGPGRLKRAAELFVMDEWGSDSGFVEKAWRTSSEPEPFFISVAASHWQIVVTTQRDLTQLTVRGPETRATITAIPADAEFFGIVFSLGSFVPAIPLSRL